jgi:hypothetical protein
VAGEELAATAVAALPYLGDWFDDATVCCDLGDVGRRGVITFVLRRGERTARVDVTRLAVKDARYPGRLAARIAWLADRELSSSNC